eukprot:jgi/Botrbrau1/13051/Bobra.0187s0013.1
MVWFHGRVYSAGVVVRCHLVAGVFFAGILKHCDCRGRILERCFWTLPVICQNFGRQRIETFALLLAAPAH